MGKPKTYEALQPKNKKREKTILRRDNPHPLKNRPSIMIQKKFQRLYIYIHVHVYVYTYIYAFTLMQMHLEAYRYVLIHIATCIQKHT